MAFSPEEQAIIDAGKKQGKSVYEVKQAIAKYRATQPMAQEVSVPEPQKGTLETVAGVLDTVFGGGTIGSAIGKQIAKGNLGDTIQKIAVGRDLTPEEEALVDSSPSAGQIAGDVLRVGANFIPVGKVAGAVATPLVKAGIGTGAAKIASNVVAGGLTGAASDIGVSMSEGQKPSLGWGTILGAGIPASAPIVKALSNAAAKGAGIVGSEIQGALTGTSAETLQQAFEAAKTGGKQLDEFTTALRGKTTPEKLVNTIRESIDTISSQRQNLFKQTLAELSDEVVSTAPAKQQFIKDLTETGITVDENGLLNFANSKLRTVPNAQAKLQQAWTEISKMPDSLPIGELDTTRQAIKGIKSIAGDEPSANLANMLIDDAVRSVRKAGEQVEGYGKMLDNFAETSDFLDEISRGLSVGDKATIDQAYRRLATSLKTNNEQRMALVRELDEMTGGAVLSGIAGQQLSEVLPRGIFRQIAAGVAGGAVLTGGISSSLIPALVFASPRVSGEVVRALGLGAAKTDIILESLSAAQNLLTKIGAIGGAEMGIKSSSNLEDNVQSK